MTEIKKVVFPVAGLGSRFLPATKIIPKEMLPIVDVPQIQLALEEAVASGIEEAIFITSRGKDSIVDHFDIAYELRDRLIKSGQEDILLSLQNLLSCDPLLTHFPCKHWTIIQHFFDF